MNGIIADALIVVFTYGVSLRTWRDTGGIARELAIYTALTERYQHIFLLTYGGPSDVEILRTALPPELHEKFSLICNQNGLDVAQFAARAPEQILTTLRGANVGDRVVVKTNQMAGGNVAVKITEHLRTNGIDAALIARGGYLWSRMSAYEHGPHHPTTVDAGRVEGELCTTANIVVGTTPGMVNDLAWRFGIDPRNTRVIPNYVVVPEECGKSASEREPGLVLYAGQLVRRKRVDLLIDAVGIIDEQVRKDIKLEIIGDGPELESLCRQAERLGAPVVFRGRLPHAQLNKRMGECSLYVQASEMEGHPKTVLEAMAAGAPVVVSNTPGLGDCIMHGVTGLRVSLEADSFSRAISELLADPEWRDVLGTGAARAAHSHLSLRSIVPLEVEAHLAAISHTRRITQANEQPGLPTVLPPSSALAA